MHRFDPSGAGISVAILSWNAAGRIGACLDSVRCFLPKSEIVVVDNGSADGTVEQVRAAAPAARLIVNPANRGFSTGCNQLAAACSRDWLLFLNDDAVILQADLAGLAVFFERAGEPEAVGFRLVDAAGRPQRTAYALPTLMDFLLEQVWLPPAVAQRRLRRWTADPARDRPQRVEGVEASAFLVSRAAFQRVGGYDEAFSPAYSEDVDLFRRLAAAGARVFWVPYVTVLHEGGASSGGPGTFRRRRAVLAKAVQYHVKWGGRRARAAICAGLLLGALWNTAYFVARAAARRGTDPYHGPAEYVTRVRLALLGATLAWRRFPAPRLGFPPAPGAPA